MASRKAPQNTAECVSNLDNEDIRSISSNEMSKLRSDDRHDSNLTESPVAVPDYRVFGEDKDDDFVTKRDTLPRTEIESTLATIWSDILGIEQIGPDDSFFNLGGHSLSAFRMLNPVAELGIDVPVSTIFESPTLSEFASAIKSHVQHEEFDRPVIKPVSRDDSLLLSFSQQRLWFLSRLNESNETYNILMDFRLRGDLKTVALQRALNVIVSRHEALRSVFVLANGRPRLELLDASTQVEIRQHDLRGLSETEAVLKQLEKEEAHNVFDLGSGPPLRAGLIRITDEDHIFLITVHHIVFDKWSMHVMMREMSVLYAAFLLDEPNPLPSLVIQYPDFASWEREYYSVKRLEKQCNYWSSELSDIPVLLEVPTDRPRATHQSSIGGYVPIVLDDELTKSLRELSTGHNVTLFMIILSAWGVVLSRLSHQNIVVIGTPRATRNRREVEDLIGFFVNTLALRLDMSESPNTRQLLARVRRTVLGAWDHQDLPFDQVVEIVQPPRSTSHSPVFQVIFAWQNNQPAELILPGLEVSMIEPVRDRVQFDLELELSEVDGCVVGGLGYATALFDRDTISRHVEYLSKILRAMLDDADVPLTRVDILTSAERTLLLHTWNQFVEFSPMHCCVHYFFEENAASRPDATALEFEDSTLTYSELNSRANSLARKLIDLGVGPEQIIGICMSRSLGLVIGLLGIMKAGAAHVALDPAYPSKRLLDILEDAGSNILIADSRGREVLDESVLEKLTLIDPNIIENSQESETNPKVSKLTSNNLAQVIYTSGSTGKPKGVMIEHRNIVRLFEATNSWVNLDHRDKFGLFHSYAFDASIWEIWGALRYGGTLVVVPYEITRSADELYTVVHARKITVLVQTPSAFQVFMTSYVQRPASDNLRYIFFGGERLDLNILKTWYDLREDTEPRLVNMYGPSETTVYATYRELRKKDIDQPSSLIGSKLSDVRIYLLDAYGQLVPLGVEGELYIGGAGVARGYLNRPDLTSERFVRNYFDDQTEYRTYKTGDIARYLPDGNLVFVRRIDEQIKIRGYRVELGDIEACLIRYPAVHAATVLVFGEGRERKLIAYVIADEENDLVRNLRLHVSTFLPDYMVPSAYAKIDQFPLTVNGKLDVNQLPVPDYESLAREEYEKPRGDLEESLTHIWSELLKIDRISRNDSFFGLGGNSLLAVSVIERMRMMGLTLTIQDMFANPVLSKLAESVRQNSDVIVPPNVITLDAREITPDMLPLIDLTRSDIDRIVANIPGGIANIQDIYALSPFQNGILFHYLFASEGDPYMSIKQMVFSDRETLDRYIRALERVIDRHDILRTSFAWEQLSSAVQVVHRRVELEVTEFEATDGEGSVTDQLEYRLHPCRYRSDIRKAPLIHVFIAKEKNGNWILHEVHHHLIDDHLSLDIVNDEIAIILHGRESTLKKTIPFRDFIYNARLNANEDAYIRFFTEMLGDVDEPSFLYGLNGTYIDGSSVVESHLDFSCELSDGLGERARHFGISLATMCHLGWALVVSRTSGCAVTVFGTVLLGRSAIPNANDGTALGPYINTLPLRINVDETSLFESIHYTHERLASLLNSEYASLALAQRCSNVDSGTPLFNSILNYRHNLRTADDRRRTMKNVGVMRVLEQTSYPVAMCIEDNQSSLGLTAMALSPIDANRLCAYMHQSLRSILQALEIKPQISVRYLEVLPESEHKRLIQIWNTITMPEPDDVCIHHLFEQRVTETPRAIAVTSDGGSLTYAELNARANSLAHELIESGVMPDQLVALCVERSLEMVVGVLGILKAGGAYVSMDPTYPTERLNDILNDAKPNIIVSDESGLVALSDVDRSTLTVIDLTALSITSEENPVVKTLSSKHLAYVIYTSGSTGKPKGVMLEHRNVTRLFDATQSLFSFDRNDVWSQMHSIAFDFSVWELWGALRYGGRLVIVPRDVVRSTDEIYRLICERQITILSQTPRAFEAFIADYANNRKRDSLRFVVLSGDRLDTGIVRSWYEVSRTDPEPKIVNMYGITETTVGSTLAVLTRADAETSLISIGTRLPDLKVYLLDEYRRPVPFGVTGELYIAGGGVARGYLNRPDLTVERFPRDPFSDNEGDRMYKTGDLVRYLPDGCLVFVDRNDGQIKIRGFRIETGEVEACLRSYTAVRAVTVVALGEGRDKRLVAYVIADKDDDLARNLQYHASARLPEYMVPSAYVKIDEFPLTANGKLDKKKLPLPEDDSAVRAVYEEPRGLVKKKLAEIWSDILRISRISRNDSFFGLGGHSLLAVRLIESMRSNGLALHVRDLFQNPVLCKLAERVERYIEVAVPPNVISPEVTEITPIMLPLIDLTQEDINRIVATVPDGVGNIQDIYSLSPIQEGMLFHHLLDSESDPYVTMRQCAFPNRRMLDSYLEAVQRVVDRFDILRTAFMWENLSSPAQVVFRRAYVPAVEIGVESDRNCAYEHLNKNFNPSRYRINVNEAPLMRYFIVRDVDDRWILYELMHHLIDDQTSILIFHSEVAALMKGRDLPSNARQFRDFIAHVRLESNEEADTEFFTKMLHDVDEPSLSYDLLEVNNDGSNIVDTSCRLPIEFTHRLHERAKCMEVTPAALFHVAWAQIVSRTSGSQRVIFGTVLSGRSNTDHNFENTMGVFINTLPVRIDIDETSISDCVRQTHSRLAHLLEREQASLALVQRCSGISSQISLFNSILNYRRYDSSTDTHELLDHMEVIAFISRTNYPLTWCINDNDDDIELNVQTIEFIDSNRVCRYTEQTLNTMVDALDSSPEMPVRSLEILPQDELDLLLKTWNDSDGLFTNESSHHGGICIHRWFEQETTKHPGAVALVSEEQILTYAELNARANNLAHQLIKLAVVPDELVAICVSRSASLTIGILAVLKAGAAYVPLDPVHSSERLVDILTDGNPKILIADAAGLVALGEFDYSTLTLIDPNASRIPCDDNPIVHGLSSKHLAYVMYTSGSTGRPKGVMVEHRNITRLFDVTEPWFNFYEGDIWTLAHSFAFDVSVWEMWGALLYGGQLVIVPQDTVRSPRDMSLFVRKRDITVLNQTPSMFKELLPNCLSEPGEDRLRFIIFAGEQLDPTILRPWYASRGDTRTKLVNMYGVTETAILATYKLLTPEDTRRSASPIGIRLPDLKVYLLDTLGRPVPVGVTGELYIEGEGVARGYFNRPDLTSQSFIPNPFSDCTELRLYKTGDLVKYLSDGSLIFLGRNDSQIKIRGFRIETGEVETCLTSYHAVHAATVLPFGEDHEKYLVAYIVAKEEDDLVRNLRAHVAARLPDFMVPSAYVRVEEFPLTLNGKLDVKKLPSPDMDSVVREEYEEPRNDVEVKLTNIWSEIFGIDTISRHDSFFGLGGHSLSAIRFIERLRLVGLTMSVRDLFEHPVLADAARIVRQHIQVEVPPNLITPDIEELTPNMLPLIDLTQGDINRIVSNISGGLHNIQDIYALSPLQDGILFHYLLAGEGDPYLTASQLTFSERHFLDAYLSALKNVIDRHDILRTAFIWKNLSRPTQVVLRKVNLPVTELEISSDNGSVSDQLKQRYNPRHYRIDICEAPLLHSYIARDVNGCWILHHLIHHLMGDNATTELMCAEIAAFIENREKVLLPPIPFRNLVARARRGVPETAHIKFFQDMLADVYEPSLSFGLTETYDDVSSITECHEDLSAELYNRLSYRMKQLEISLASSCHLAWALVVSRTSGRDKTVFGTVMLGRSAAGEGSNTAFGPYINTLPLRIDVDDTPVWDSLRRTQSRLFRLLEHEHASLALVQRCSGIGHGTPLFNSILNYTHKSSSTYSNALMKGLVAIEYEGRTNYPFSMSVDDDGNTFDLIAQVQSINSSRVCAYMKQALSSIVDAVECSSQMLTRSLEVLPPSERTLLLETWNACEPYEDSSLCIHHLFEQRVTETPSGNAVIYGEQVLTYEQVNHRANNLAHQLIELGVVPDDLVGICVERSLALIVGILAILKAGGCYVPLDPVYSSERLIDNLIDASPKVILADDVGRAALIGLDLSAYTVVDPNTLPSSSAENPRVDTLSSSHLAYCIYTSGSTGKPKGVLVEHRNIVRLWEATNSWLRSDQHDVFGLFHSCAFDVSVWEFWGALRYGGTLVIVPYDTTRSAQEVYSLVRAQKITVFMQTPSAFEAFIVNYIHNPMQDHLRCVILGGERLDLNILKPWFAIRGDSNPQIINFYGNTETTVHAVFKQVRQEDVDELSSPIGWRIKDLKVYLLDDYRRPVPLGVTGEIYISGPGVTRGYLNRPELTRERFLVDPFNQCVEQRMYKTGDLARYSSDGCLLYLGRNDDQIKIRGYRIEPGEIETRLTSYPSVRAAKVIAFGQGREKKMIAYVLAESEEDLVRNLRRHVAEYLPDYMVPSAYVQIDEFPLMPHGKLDVRQLPLPGSDSIVRRDYEEPKGQIEKQLAMIWSELLGVDRISRFDSFFEIGGHSLHAVKIIEQLRLVGLTMAVRDLFKNPVLMDAAKNVRQRSSDVGVPPNLITPDIQQLTPSMLPLIDLTQADIDQIISNVSVGLDNIQDIYALSPLQDGILFHYLLATEGDPYLLMIQLSFKDRSYLERYLRATQLVVDRHDILRTAFLWEELSVPAQVVLRRAPIHVTEHSFAFEEQHFVADQLKQRFDPRRYRIDIRQAPLMHFHIAQESDGRWIMHQLQHHLIGDHETADFMFAEVSAILDNKEADLPVSIPFRNLVAHSRLTISEEADERFFTEMLGDVNEPSLLFDLNEVHHDGSEVGESYASLSFEVHHRLQEQAKSMNTSLATLCHVAWALVVSRTSNIESVVFGTVLLGRMNYDSGHGSALGLFINTLPIRIDVDATSVYDCVRRTHARFANLFEHEHASLALAQRCSGVENGMTLFTSLLNYRHNVTWDESSFTSNGIEIIGTAERTNYPVTVSVEDYGHLLGFTTLAVSPVDPKLLCAYIQQSLCSLVEALELTPRISIRSLDVLPPIERNRLLTDWNSSTMPEYRNDCLHRLFEQSVAKNPTSVALISDKCTLSYEELNDRSNVLAHELIALGVVPDELVTICVQRSHNLVIGTLAILKSGGAYLPLDPIYPSERLILSLTNANPRILIADAAGLVALGDFERLSLTVIDPNEISTRSNANPIVPGLSERHLAYVTHTSGSTGRPKGVMVEHRHIVSLFEATESLFHFNEHDVWGLLHSSSFDVSVWETWGALLYGGHVVVVPHNVARSPLELCQFVREYDITVINQTPSAFNAYVSHYLNDPAPDRLRYVIFTGEKVNPTTLRPWFAVRDSSRTKLVNMYGITETTVHAAYRLLTPEDTKCSVSPIGRSLPNLKFYLLDRHGRPVPIGVAGELYISGQGVTRGYLNQLDLTNERFLPNPFSECPEDRLYKTGDLARYLFDGSFIFIGRNDSQIKYRGFRIEPGEIEACLRNYHAVHAATVLAFGEEPEKRLVAYIVADPETDLVRNLRHHVSDRLPEYMVPSVYVQIEEFPLTPNGKLDYKRLPAPDTNSVVREAYEEPRNDIEKRLAAIWRDLLKLERISRYDSFFELGGHSLLAMRLVERMRSVRLSLTVSDVFQFPILFELAENIRRYKEVEVPPNVITPGIAKLAPNMLPLIDLTQHDIDHIVATVSGGLANIQDIYSLSPLQDGILFHHIFASDSDPYVTTTHTTFTNRELLDRYLAALQRVIDRHDILRTAFVWEGLSTPAQVVLRQASLRITEFALEADGDLELKHRPDFSQYRIDVREAPLLSCYIVPEKDDSWSLHTSTHHLIDDQTSFRIMYSEIATILNGKESVLLNPTPYREFIAYVRSSSNAAAHIKFFSNMLADIDEPSLSYDLVRVHDDGSHVTDSSRWLSTELNNNLRDHGKRVRVPLAVFFHLTWALIVSRTSGCQKAVFGTVLSGRSYSRINLDSAMGPFINTLPFRMDIDETSVEECVVRVHRQLVWLLEYEHASLAVVQRCSRIKNGIPLFNSLLNYRQQASIVDVGGLVHEIKSMKFTGRTNYPLDLSVDDLGRGIHLITQAIHPIDGSRILAYMEKTLGGLVEALGSSPQISVRSLQMLPESERSLLTEIRNESVTLGVEQPCIHRLFERRVPQLPERIALISGNHTLTYAELNDRANVLAKVLIELGVVTEQLVAICVDRSITMIVSILAILKAGGAYIPLDPRHSSKRLIDILDDGRPNIILADDVGSIATKHVNRSKFIFVNPNTLDIQSRGNPVVDGLTSANLAYVIYTSGTTGKPKGVLVEHRNAVRLLDACESLFHMNQNDVWALWWSVASDASVWVIWGALCFGGRLVLIPHEVSCSPQEMYRCVCSHKITMLDITPTAFEESIASYVENPGQDDLRYVVLGAERLDFRILRPWFDAGKNSQCRVVNTYGPTEATVQATYKLINREDTLSTSSPIGECFTHLKVYVLDARGQLALFGVTGELYIGGDGVARGYLNRPELTSMRFLPDPFSTSMDARMYKTGDLVRYLPEGSLEYIGRNDRQVKIRGFRIEPGEIEACLVKHPLVRAAAALAFGEKFDERLIAYVVAEADDDLIRKLREHVAAELPEHMVPSAYVRVAEIPFTPNGQLDAEKLPKPGENDVVRDKYDDPRGEIERSLALSWSEVLGIKRIGRYDSFFLLGGHSLLAVRLTMVSASRGLIFTLYDLFQHPILADLASNISLDSRSDRPLAAIPIRTVGTESPVFFAPTGINDISYVFALAQNIQSQCPIYALPWPKLTDNPHILSMETLALQMVDVIQRIQPEGPYRLFGYSSGGVLAYSIAAHLVALDESIGFLGFIDTDFPNASAEQSTPKLNALAADVAYVCQVEEYADLVVLAENMKESDCIEFLRAAQTLKFIPQELCPDSYLREYEERIQYTKFVRDYVPRDLGLTIHQFYAAESTGDSTSMDNSILSTATDTSLAWAPKFVNSIFHTTAIPGNHDSLMREYDNRFVLCCAIDSALSQTSLLH